MPLFQKLIAPRRRLVVNGLALLGILIALALLITPRLLGEKVVVLIASQGELTQSVVASGKVRSPQRVELSSQISGRVARIWAHEGQKVVAGQMLIQLDDAEWRAAAAQASASLAQSVARLGQMGELTLPLARHAQQQAAAHRVQALKSYERVGELAARGFYSQTQLDDAQRTLEVAESQWQATQLQTRSSQVGGSDYRLAQVAVEQARASLQGAQSKLAYTQIFAPVSGTLLTRSIEPGDTAQPGKPLLTLSPNGDTELIVQIDEKNLRLLNLGQQAQVSAEAYREQRFSAEVIFIGPSIDPLRGSVEIRLRVVEAPAYLRQEMTVSIDIETARRANAIMVSADAVRDAASPQPWALVVRDGFAQRQEVTLGLRSDGKLEILSGLNVGDQLVPARQSSVRVGSRVRAVAA
jgi:HlyD family secretion protein